MVLQENTSLFFLLTVPAYLPTFERNLQDCKRGLKSATFMDHRKEK